MTTYPCVSFVNAYQFCVCVCVYVCVCVFPFDFGGGVWDLIV